MGLKKRLQSLTYKCENNFFLTVVRRGLTMMIPFILVGGISCALVNLPYVDYSSDFMQKNFGVLIKHCQNVPFHCSCFLELIIVFVIHESCAAKVSHLYSGCQVFRGFCLLKDV